jgi:hypothetical protein
MKLVSHPAVVALGAATLCFLPLISPLISPSHIDVYHLSSSAFGIYIPVVVNVAFLWLIFTGLLSIAQKSGAIQRFIWLAIILFLPWVALKIFATLIPLTLPHGVSLSIFGLSIATYLVLLFTWQPAFEPTFRSARNFVSTLLAFTAFSGIILLSQLLLFAWQARSLNAARPLHRPSLAAADRAPKARILWILLDELSYQQVYEHRFPGLELPAFDQFAAQATVFTRVSPAGVYTHAVIPSLFTGRAIDRVRSTPDGRLIVHEAASNRWQAFDPHDTVFQDALNNGYSTAIAGWFNPYCRIMPQVLDRCYWTSHIPFINGFTADQPFASNLFEPLKRFLSLSRSFLGLRDRVPANATRDAMLHVNDYQDLFAQGDLLLADPSLNFVFLHMPVPHPEGIYDRRNSTFVTSGSSYIDNLALADRYLAHVQQLLEKQGQWDATTVIVMGDHSWRTSLLWMPSPIWTAEDQAASHGGQFDNRPAYIIKLPNQQQHAQVDRPFSAVDTRALLDALINNRIASAQELQSWAGQQTATVQH